MPLLVYPEYINFILLQNCSKEVDPPRGEAIWFVCLMMFNATFNNISVISWRSVLLVEETRGHGENH
jgi:hypothetical protein